MSSFISLIPLQEWLSLPLLTEQWLDWLFTTHLSSEWSLGRSPIPETSTSLWLSIDHKQSLIRPNSPARRVSETRSTVRNPHSRFS